VAPCAGAANSKGVNSDLRAMREEEEILQIRGTPYWP
jgi:hypothetical protein